MFEGVGTAMRDAQGRVASWAQRSWQERPGFGKRASRADAVLGGYSALRFVRGSHERVSQTDCVLPVGAEALPFMRRRFADRQHADAVSGLGMVASAEFTGSFTCYWDQGANTLACGGVQCRAGSSLRAVSSAGAMVNADGGSFSGVYTCDNGCTITALVDGSGGWDCGPDEWWSRGNGGGEAAAEGAEEVVVQAGVPIGRWATTETLLDMTPRRRLMTTPKCGQSGPMSNSSMPPSRGIVAPGS